MSYGNPLHGLDSRGNRADQEAPTNVRLSDLAFTPDDTGIDLPLDDTPRYPDGEPVVPYTTDDLRTQEADRRADTGDLWRRATHIPGVYVTIDAGRQVLLRTPLGDIPVAKPLELASDLDTAAGMAFVFGDGS